MYVLMPKEFLYVLFHIDHDTYLYSSVGQLTQFTATFLNGIDTRDSARDPSQAKPARERLRSQRVSPASLGFNQKHS
jgi:hypothetical protein